MAAMVAEAVGGVPPEVEVAEGAVARPGKARRLAIMQLQVQQVPLGLLQPAKTKPLQGGQLVRPDIGKCRADGGYNLIVASTE
jgi:hypothetical protein